MWNPERVPHLPRSGSGGLSPPARTRPIRAQNVLSTSPRFRSMVGLGGGAGLAAGATLLRTAAGARAARAGLRRRRALLVAGEVPVRLTVVGAAAGAGATVATWEGSGAG